MVVTAVILSSRTSCKGNVTAQVCPQEGDGPEAQPQREAAYQMRSEFASPVSLSSLYLPDARLNSTKPRAPCEAWKARRISVEGRAPEYRDGPAHLSARGPGPRTRPNGNVGGGFRPSRGAQVSGPAAAPQRCPPAACDEKRSHLSSSRAAGFSPEHEKEGGRSISNINNNNDGHILVGF